ncbi:uncharacterized protein LOC112184080 [Rosa chinensis]|uniref:uncharacterized protein LOC112184080 n=1 Tax=Rosa chinensis TaxID=74649 RepID=UPI000D091722|nr:uncharacterized protein LOC112184080 [Rosa chinensis]
MAACGFVDMGFVGSRFTWGNKYTKERLDRSFQTIQWRSLFPFSRVITLHPSESDHCPILIEKEWALPTTGNVLGQIGFKFKVIGQKLMKWHQKDFDKQKVEMRIIQEKLNDIMRQPFSPEQYEEQRTLHAKYSHLLSQQEKYWRQRSRAVWLKDGDRNSAFFHCRASNRKSRNSIRGLTDEQGQWQSEPAEIKRLLLTYFTTVFSSEGCDARALQMVLDATPTKVTRSMNESLVQPYIDDEIKAALFQMHPSKSPGPDGMSPFFFQKYWNVVSMDVCNAIRNFLEKGELWPESNYTYLCLIPKIKSPKVAAHFRPIALCNVICLIASKVVANRLKCILPEIISPLQSAYVPGRLISDNTLVATEATHFMYQLKGQQTGFFSLKLDISKAYDRLEWPFIQAMLLKLGFQSSWVQMIMSCISQVTYSILIQGEPSTKLSPTRGIRQGDPLSPYIFILCAEGLSALISDAVQHNAITGLQMCPQAPTLHHLFFADDSFLFGTATEGECYKFKAILDTYERASGQQVNYQKSSMAFSRNVDMDRQNKFASILGVTRVDDHDRYLGLPLRVGRSKTAIFEYIKEKLTKKLINWKAKILSCAGKEILIKAVAQTMPLYAMNCYLLPRGLCVDIHKLCASFFWGDTNEKKKIHWRNWDKLCLTKKEGGMEFKNLYAYNLAMLAKQGWRLVTNPTSLIARLFKARYFPNCSFWEAGLGDSPSFSWRSILNGRPVLKAGIQWKIGDGQSVSIWHDRWILVHHPIHLQQPATTDFHLVADLINQETREWIPASVYALFPSDIASKILCIPFGRRQCSDKLIWSPEKKGFYSVKSANWIAREQVLQNVLTSTSNGDPFNVLWQQLWKAKIPGKVLICNWRACNNLLATRERLLAKGYTGTIECLLCQSRIEDNYHLFCQCPLAKQILSAPPFNLQHTLVPTMSFKEWMLERAQQLKLETLEKLMMVVWALWKNRNNGLWEGKVQTAHDLVLSCFTWLADFQKSRSKTPTTNRSMRAKWKPPTSGFKLNVDAAFLPNQTTGGIGGVLRDSTGQFRAAFFQPEMFVASPKQCELLAIRASLDLLSSCGIHDVSVESDCMEAVSEANCRNYDLLANGGIVDDIHAVWSKLQGVTISHTPQTCNAVAHRLAALGFENPIGAVWFDQAPSSIHDILQHDCAQLV